MHGERPSDRAWAWARSLLRLVCPHARRDRFADGHLGLNRMPFHRLFLVHPQSSADGSRVVDLAAGRALPLLPAAVLTLPIGRRYRFEFAPGFSLVGFHFRLEAAPGQDVLGDAVPFTDHGRDHRLAQEAWDALAVDDGGAWLRSEGLLRLLLGRAIVLPWPRLDAALALERRWGPVLRLLDADAGPTPSVAALARRTGLSRTHFSRRFHAEFGLSPRDWRAQRLAERAVERLLATPVPVQELAAELGFADGFAFSRFVRRTTGLSPTALRARGPWGG